ncbi:type 4 pilus major pilin [Pectobacterium odoriferum]|uniref:type 4 pilus major pilin n=1 Tax=Pectobacterium odoriferum TaxID=78398 RepID=UPI0015DF6BA5|nr:type 4 pilus major pilin [Pectobacterium odoriferum]MBA0190415.1 hypothetical protein [Pectobacterium odoriferum]
MQDAESRLFIFAPLRSECDGFNSGSRSFGLCVDGDPETGGRRSCIGPAGSTYYRIADVEDAIRGDLGKGITIQGARSSGTATLWNSWGGQIVLAPVASNGFNNGFTLTSEKIPQEACIAIVTRMSASGTASGITINSASHEDGLVSLESAGSECLADTGRTGQNKLTFTING